MPLAPLLIAPFLIAAAAQDAPRPGPVHGQGPYRVTMAVPPSLPTHTLYVPEADAGRRADRPWPALVWANGGCSDAGSVDAPLLAEIASRGYVVVALGTIKPPAAPPPARAAADDLARKVAESRGRPAPTQTRQLSQAIDWLEQAARQGPLKGRVDPTRIAAAGHSCGGLQAIAASAQDRRVRTTIMLNSGIFEQPMVRVDKGALERLRGPVLYVIGGKDDIAHDNAEDDYRRIARVPVVKVTNALGHGGGITQPFGGPSAPIVIRWLDWQLKGDAAAARDFTGARCGLCTRPDLTIERKGLQ